MDTLALPLTLLLAESAWLAAALAAWGSWLDRSPARAPLLTFPVVLLTLGAGYLAGAGLLRRAAPDQARPGRLDDPQRRAIAVALGLAWCVPAVWLSRHLGDDPRWLDGLLAAVPRLLDGPTPDLAATAAAVLLWWRGQRAGATPPDYPAAVHSFGIGTLALAAALVAAGLSGRSDTTLAVATPLFLVSGLAALSCARFQDVRREVEAGRVRSNPGPVSASWTRATAPPILLVLGVGLLAALLFGDDQARRTMLGALGSAGEAVWSLFYYPLVVVGYLVELLVLFVQSLPRVQIERQQPAQPSPLDALTDLAAAGAGGPPAWLAYVRVAVILGAAAALLALLIGASGITRREPPAPASDAAERESLWSWRGAWRAVWSWLAALPSTWAARARRLATGLAERRPADEASRLSAGDVRALYRRFLSLGRAAGFPRAAHRTAHEYLEQWEERLPEGGESAALTEAYVQVRYAPPAVPHPDPATLEPLLDRLQRKVAAGATKTGAAPQGRSGAGPE